MTKPQEKCQAVIRVQKIQGRCTIFYRNKTELEQMENVAGQTIPKGRRIHLHQLYPVKVYSAPICKYKSILFKLGLLTDEHV